MDLEGIQLTEDKILIRRADASDMKRGLVIPEHSIEKPQDGFVVLLGPWCQGDGRISRGDWVMFKKFAGLEVGEPSDRLVLVDYDDILMFKPTIPPVEPARMIGAI